MDGSHVGKVVKIVFRMTVPIILTVPIKYFQIQISKYFLLVNQN